MMPSLAGLLAGLLATLVLSSPSSWDLQSAEKEELEIVEEDRVERAEADLPSSRPGRNLGHWVLEKEIPLLQRYYTEEHLISSNEGRR